MAGIDLKLPIQVNLPDDWVEQIVNRLRNDPEAEWVEIVRCEDCKYFYKNKWCIRYLKAFTPDDYCSYAERRTDEGD